VAALRPLLAQTRLEEAKLNLIYDAVKDGWKKGDFHRKVDNRGASLVVARTRGGAVCGGYNPEVGREGGRGSEGVREGGGGNLADISNLFPTHFFIISSLAPLSHI